MRPLVLSALVVLMTSPLAAQRGKRGCPDIAVDSATGAVATYLACQVDREARPRGFAPRIDWTPPISQLRDGDCYRANFEFVVDTLGIPEMATIRDLAANNAGFQQAVRDAIPLLRYSPALLNRVPVRQRVSYAQSAAIRVVARSSPSGMPPMSRTPRC